MTARPEFPPGPPGPPEPLGPQERRLLRAGPRLSCAGLDRLMPMHVWAGPRGHILHVGPTLAKLCPERRLVGTRLLETFEIRRPRRAQTLADLMEVEGGRVHLLFRAAPRTGLRGDVVALPEGRGAILNLSLGISVVEAVGRFRLTGRDFAASDPTVEMLYLIEAQTAVLDESRRLNQRLQGAKTAAEAQALTDTLTGLGNRRAMTDALAALTQPPVRERFGLMHLDLDYFKQVNDSFGHAAGDHVLQEVARILREETRAEDLVARVGGDEFVLIFRNCDDLDLLDRIAGRIIERLQQPIPFDGKTCRVSASIGTTISAHYPRPDPEQMLGDADVALYSSKHQGRARHTVFRPSAAARPGEGAAAANGAAGLRPAAAPPPQSRPPAA